MARDIDCTLAKMQISEDGKLSTDKGGALPREILVLILEATDAVGLARMMQTCRWLSVEGRRVAAARSNRVADLVEKTAKAQAEVKEALAKVPEDPADITLSALESADRALAAFDAAAARLIARYRAAYPLIRPPAARLATQEAMLGVLAVCEILRPVRESVAFVRWCPELQGQLMGDARLDAWASVGLGKGARPMPLHMAWVRLHQIRVRWEQLRAHERGRERKVERKEMRKEGRDRRGKGVGR